MVDCCVICTEQLPVARATLKCGHSFCSECIMNNIARNTGTEEGSSRNKCPMCRQELCMEVLPSVNITIHMGDLKDEIDGLRADLQDRQEDLIHLKSDLKFSATNNVFYKKKCNELEVKLEDTYTNMIKFKDDAAMGNFLAEQRADTIRRIRSITKRVSDMLSDYRRVHTDSALDMLQTSIRSIRYPSLPLPCVEQIGHTAHGDGVRNVFNDSAADGPETFTPCRVLFPDEAVEGDDYVTAGDYLLAATVPADDVDDITLIPEIGEISVRRDILSVNSPASDFFRLAEILNMRIPFGLEDYLPIEESYFPANETRILKTIANHLNGIDKAVGIDLTAWWTGRGGSVDDILTINPCGGDYLILKANALDRIIGSKIGNLLSMFGLVKKYSNESVASQRTRLKKVLDLRDEPRRALVGRWIDEKIPELVMLDM